MQTLAVTIELKVARADEAYREAKTIFLDKCANNVGFATEGYLKDVLVREATWFFMQELNSMVRDETGDFLRPAVVRTRLERILKDAEQRIIKYCEFEANSTSPLHNLKRTYEAVARCKMVEWLKESLEDSEGSEAICGHCGQTGTFALGHDHCDYCELDTRGTALG